jgi:nicotinamidase-related amidase
MSEVIELKTYLGAANCRLLVMVDLQESNYCRLAKEDCAAQIDQTLESCRAAIRHARSSGIPIAFTRRAGDLGLIDGSASSAWIAGLEPKRSDMVFGRQQPSCYSNQLFEDIVAQIGSFAIGGLIADETCLATAIDASHRGHRVTFLSDASASRGRQGADARAVHAVATKAIELFADIATTGHWLLATSQRPLKGHPLWMN